MVQVHFSDLQRVVVVPHLNAHVYQIISDYLAIKKGARGGNKST